MSGTAVDGGVGPVRPSERIEILDILRGWALFGVLLCNIRWFAGFGEDYDLWTSTTDGIARLLIQYAADDKFYTLFSFLFGLGFALQMGRAQSRGVPFVGRYARRLGVLFLIGLVHTYLAWWDEALHVYALVGFLLLLFRVRSNRTVLGWAVICLIVVPALSYSTAAALAGSQPEDPETSAETMRERQGGEDWAANESRIWFTTRGTVSQWAAENGRTWVERGKNYHTSSEIILTWFSPILGLFLLGMYVGRRGILERLSTNRRFFRRTMWCGLAIGVPCTLGAAVLDAMGVWKLWLPARLAWILGAPALCFFYAAAIVVLAQRDRWHRLLAPLGAAGRMALTGYVGQSVVCVLLFYGFGLGWYGKTGPAMGMALTVVIFAIQVLLSMWWLRHFRFGPLEWLWRSLTYGRVQPLRLKQNATVVEAVA